MSDTPHEHDWRVMVFKAPHGLCLERGPNVKQAGLKSADGIHLSWCCGCGAIRYTQYDGDRIYERGVSFKGVPLGFDESLDV